ncbi:uncharacterized protein HMPREF1541_09235 [Cyphellophora europaea CBS 101466]|uniref:Uncharacterized protein n=1 Tax=Cyphellophora europaea (strain CBS 101466) TaxID=1220924 RepID=W2SBW9_CYPE1|nr:uncharacterized protein HMPREF1541_09235 [Cyphellophora europaea CBS 101466]ETN45404.1 hypothetical protein HMPREF1541_09235 [Cyphellophora europaea CBS 101466]
MRSWWTFLRRRIGRGSNDGRASSGGRRGWLNRVHW